MTTPPWKLVSPDGVLHLLPNEVNTRPVSLTCALARPMLPVQGMASSSLRACPRQLCHSPACAYVLAVCSKPTPPVPMVGQECRGPRDLLSTPSSTTPRRPRSAGSWRRGTEATVPREGDLDGGDSFDMVRRRAGPAFARASHPASRPPFLPFSRFSTLMRWPAPLRGPT